MYFSLKRKSVYFKTYIIVNLFYVLLIGFLSYRFNNIMYLIWGTTFFIYIIGLFVHRLRVWVGSVNYVFQVFVIIFGLAYVTCWIVLVLKGKGYYLSSFGVLGNTANIISVKIFLLSIMLVFLLLILFSVLIKRSKALIYISSLSMDKSIAQKYLKQGKDIVERKYKVVVFGDIRGFTEFMEGETEDVAVEVLEGFYNIVEDCVRLFGGFKVEFIADEFLTFFDNSEEAIDFCIYVRDQLKEYLKGYQLGIGLGVSGGGVTGKLWGSEFTKKYTYLGRAVNLASRLQSIACSGQILIDGNLYKRVADKVSVLEVKNCVLKGFQDSINVYSITKSNDMDNARLKCINLANSNSEVAQYY